MADTPLDSFLLAIGFKVDEASHSRAERAIASFAASVVGLAAAVTAAATATVAGVAKISSQMEQLYYSSQRIGSSVENIQALTFAIGQAGGSASSARGALEGLGNFIRSNPGAEGFIRRLGVDTRDTHGNLRDASDMLHDVGQRLKSMPYARARLIAGVMGVDENTLQALFRGTDAAATAIHKMYHAAGLNADQAAKGAAGFMNQLRLFGAAIGILEQGVAAKMQGGIGKEVDRLRERLVANFGRISDIIAWVAHVVLKVADALVTMGLEGARIAEKFYDWFESLHKSTRKWIVGIGLAELALRALSRGFMATPLGRVLAIGAAVWALWQDYQTFKAGGKSLIDWKAWSGDIDSALKAFDKLEAAWDKLWPKLKEVAGPFLEWFGHQFAGAIKDTLLDLGDAADAIRMAMSGDYKGARDKLAGIGKREAESFTPGANSPPGYLTTGAPALNKAQSADNERIAFQFFKGLGLNDKQASAFVGSGIQESGLNPGSVGDYVNGAPTAGGIFQWHEDRRNKILAATGIDVWHASLQDQLKGAQWELTHGYAGAFKQVLGDPDTRSAVSDVTNAYLQPKDRAGETIRRTPIANAVLSRQALGAGSGSPGAPAAAGGITLNSSVVVHGATEPHRTAHVVKHAVIDGNNRLMKQATGPRYA